MMNTINKVKNMNKYNGQITFQVNSFINHNAFLNSMTEEIGNDVIYEILINGLTLKDYISIDANFISQTNFTDIKQNDIIKINNIEFKVIVIFDGYISLETAIKNTGEHDKIYEYENLKYREWKLLNNNQELPF